MAHGERTETRTDGNVKTTYSYSIDTAGFGYSIIDDASGIRNDFDFLIVDMPNKLDEISAYLDAAASVTTGFEVDDLHDIAQACDNVEKDISTLKTTLAELHSAFMTDIDNINAVLAYNFGWVKIGKVKGVTRSEVIPQENGS